MQNHIRFSENYHKLRQNVFPTVRGKSWFNNLREGQIFKILKFDREFCSAEVIDAQKAIVEDLPLLFMKWDGEFPGFEINSKQDYVDLLNKFRRFHPLTLGDEVTVIHLRKIPTLGIGGE